MDTAETKDLVLIILALVAILLSVVAIVRVTILGETETKIIYCHDPKAAEMFKRGDELFEQAFEDMKS